MEENVALDSSKQKQFVKSIKGIKKLIKKNDAAAKIDSGSADTLKTKDGKVRKRKRKERGLVYLSHIPHGFYENEMTQYFKQFGMVTNARVIRSKRTGNSKGFAFVEFREPVVAEIVAETMNNYLMGKRLIKAVYIPPEKQKLNAMRKHWSATNNPGNDKRIKMKKAYNENKDEKGELQRARKLLSNLSKTKKKLSEIGISYEFFAPVDVPEVLADAVKIKSENEDVKVQDSTIKETKTKSKKSKQTASVQEEKTIVTTDKKGKLKNVKNIGNNEVVQKQEDKTRKGKQDKAKKVEKKQEIEVSENKQNQKNKKLNKAGVKPVENFIKIQEDSDSDGSLLEFDSDEYEKMMEHENEDVSSGDDDDSENTEYSGESDEDTDDESEEASPKNNKGKHLPKVAQSVQLKKKGGKQEVKQSLPQQIKRKAPQKAVVAATSKKPKFEKQTNQKPRNKQFKKKK